MPPNEEACKSFNSLYWNESKLLSIHIQDWHDSKLLSLHIEGRNDAEDVVLEIALRQDSSENDPKPWVLFFEDVALVMCDIDMQFKGRCADAISSAICRADSELTST